MNNLLPGRNPQWMVMIENKNQFEKYAAFLDGCMIGEICDLGEKNAKMEYLKKRFNIQVDQIENIDFDGVNFVRKYYDVVCCFEVLEHLTNHKRFMKYLVALLKDKGRLFLSVPHRPFTFLWGEFHYCEVAPWRLKRFILEPLGLEVVRMKRIHTFHHLRYYLTGLRPFMRLFFNSTYIYEIKKK